MEKYNKIKKNIIPKVFYLTLVFIGVGSTGAGMQNNINISYGFLYFFILMSIFFNKEIIENINLKIFTPILVMLISFFISSIFSTFGNSNEVWLRYYAILSCVLFSYFSYILIIYNYFNYKNIFIIVGLVGFFHTCVLLNIWFSQDNPKLFNWVNGIPYFSNIRHLADFLSISFICSFLLFLSAISKRAKFLWFIISISILSCVFWTGSRAAYISLIFSVVFLIFFSKNKLINIFFTVFLIVVSVIISLLFQTNNNNLGLFRSANRSIGSDLNDISSGRVELYKNILEWFIYHPVWGNGGEAVKSIGIYQGPNNLIAQAHNSILQILVEFGLMGFFCFLFIFFRIFSIFKYEKINEVYVACSAIIINIIIASLFNGGAYYVVTISLMCLFLAISFSYKKLNTRCESV